MNLLLTDEIKRFRQLFEGHEQGGLRMQGRHVETIIAKINTLLAMAGELEEENSMLRWNQTGKPFDPDPAGGNVVLLETQPTTTADTKRGN